MGCGQSSDRQGEAVSRNIEEQLKKDREVYKNELKLLILGCGESGKSTIVKQMTLIHGKGYTDEQKLSFKECIFSNTIVSIQVILQAMEALEIVLNDDANAVHRDVILNFDQVLDCDCLPPEVIKAIQELWKDSGVQHCYSRSREYQLNDSAEYLFNSVERFAKADYIPTDQDILRARMKTLGVQESLFQVGKVTYRMVDVGGQRSERKKWIHCFENVSAVIFMSAISEFDQTLQEDTPVNRMTEAYTLFDSICNLRWFANVSSILFLNKTDLLKKKLEKTQLKDWCPDYEGDNSYDSAAEYFKGKFIALNRNQAKHVYVHFTCATDTTQVKFVMSAVNDIIVKANLKDCGLV